MEEIYDLSGFENSIKIQSLLFRLKKLCAIPDCTQQTYNGATHCYAHQKARDGLFSLEVQIGGSIYEDYE